MGGKNSQSRLQLIDYSYNIRGWLKQINNPNNLGSDLFAFKIGYNEGANPLYNGNISLTQWRSANTDNSLKTYNYTYDALNRIKTAIDNLDRYSLSNVSYDKNGNILSLTRKGHIVADPDKNISSDFGIMDNLTYTYQANSNKLLKVSDAIVTPSAVQGEFKDDHNQTTPDPTNDYTYDANGNMKTDTNKGITNINYNHLNLPVQISINGMGQTGTITYIYDATGVKMRKTVSTGATTDYAGNYIYENGTLKFFSHPEGYVEPDGTNFDYVYQYKDHLGNVRLSYKDNNGTLEIIEENNYYPFGLKHKGYNTNITSTNIALKRKFGGKEYQDELGLDWYDITARNYDPALGRWMNIDQLAEKPHQISHSPYQAMLNNPVLYIDPDGMEVKNGEAGNLQKAEDNLELAKSSYEEKTGKTYEKKSKDDFETNKEWRNHKKETKEVRKAENNLNIAQKRFDLVENVIKDFANVDEVNFDKLNTLTTINHLGEEVNIDVIVTVGNTNMHGGAYNSIPKSIFNTIFGNEVKIFISPKYEIGSNLFAHEGGHIYSAAISPNKYFNAVLPKDFRSCQDKDLRNNDRVKTAIDWQENYDKEKNKKIKP